MTQRIVTIIAVMLKERGKVVYLQRVVASNENRISEVNLFICSDKNSGNYLK
jgi:hypothetical protein